MEKIGFKSGMMIMAIMVNGDGYDTVYRYSPLSLEVVEKPNNCFCPPPSTIFGRRIDSDFSTAYC